VPPGTELRAALRSCRGALIAIALFSCVLNLLMLTGSLFMLEVYDRVLPSRSVSTLVGLCLIAAILFAAQGLLDLIRGRLLVRVGSEIDAAVSPRVFDAMVRQPVRAGSRGDELQALRDLDAIRSFLSGSGPTAIFDLPWLPFYLLIVFAFHPLLGLTATIGALVLVLLTALTEALMRRPMRQTTAHASERLRLAEASVRNADALAGMGFASRLRRAWLASNAATSGSQRGAADIGGGLGAIARVLRTVLQSAVLAVGALLVIRQEASAGIIIASSILAARALAPVDTAIAQWRSFVAARQSWRRLAALLAKSPADSQPIALPAPATRLQADRVTVAPPGQQKIALRDVSLSLNRGQGLAVIGPSGSGKSSLARALVGAWLPLAGSVRLDGASLDQWAAEELGRHIGYLPQGVELFAGSIAANIARFDPGATAQSVIAAAQAAEVHEFIVGLPQGYETDIGLSGAALSPGQRQRIALARALYGHPFLVVLDEPDAALDPDGERALLKAIQGVRARGGIVVVVSHRPGVLGAVDMLLALQGGQCVAIGPKELVAQKLGRAAATGSVHILKSLPDPVRGKP
jgi:ATP-binding cassette subfamily C protein